MTIMRWKATYTYPGIEPTEYPFPEGFEYNEREATDAIYVRAEDYDALAAKLAGAEARVGEMEARYDRLTVDYGKRADRLAEAERQRDEAWNTLREARDWMMSLDDAKWIDEFLARTADSPTP